MTDLIDTTEMYLRTVLELEEEGVPALRVRIGERLGHTGPTVSETVRRLCDKGLMQLTDGEARTPAVALTSHGRVQAVSVMRKHRLAERLLSDVIGLELPYVHEEACRWEHVMSDRVEALLEQLLASPATSPYGTPIPGAAPQNRGGVSLTDIMTGGGAEFFEVAGTDCSEASSAEEDGSGPAVGTMFGPEREYTLELIPESVQTHADVLRSLYDAGLVPGAPVVISGSFSSRSAAASSPLRSVTLRRAGSTKSVELPAKLAAAVLVS